MKVSIEYCAIWNYYPKAASLAAHIKDKLGIEVGLIASGGGVFEVRKDGDLVHSKRATGRFPEPDQIIKALS